MRNAPGRKAILVISSGVDTFSKASDQDALAAARNGGTPIYAIDIGPALQNSLEYSSGAEAGPYVRMDWKRAETALQQIAQASGGRMYPVQSTFNLANVYDDLMENLRLRYVIKYKSSAAPGSAGTHSIRVELIEPETGAPLTIVDLNGKTVSSPLSFSASCTIPRASVPRAVERLQNIQNREKTLSDLRSKAKLRKRKRSGKDGVTAGVSSGIGIRSSDR